jgi:hypothetical protein
MYGHWHITAVKSPSVMHLHDIRGWPVDCSESLVVDMAQ